MGKGSSSATHFSAGNSISFVVASGVDSVDSVVGGMFLVGGVKCCACSVWMRLVGAVSVIGYKLLGTNNGLKVPNYT